VFSGYRKISEVRPTRASPVDSDSSIKTPVSRSPVDQLVQLLDGAAPPQANPEAYGSEHADGVTIDGREFHPTSPRSQKLVDEIHALRQALSGAFEKNKSFF
jgi:hypothetical protein